MTFFHPRWPVFFEDNHLLVMYKPAGLIMQRGQKDKANLIDLAKLYLKESYAKPGQVFAGMVHRLDAPVAGVVAIARTSKAAGRLSAQFRQGRVAKTYLAVVHGQPPKQTERLVHHLVRDGRLSRLASPDTPGSQTAGLSYRVLETCNQFSLLAVELETGRRHQIRLQLSSIGNPILGDRTYGSGRLLGHGRIALLAFRLAFTHPTRNTTLNFECPYPEGWPWTIELQGNLRPLWTIEEYEQDGLKLPVDCCISWHR